MLNCLPNSEKQGRGKHGLDRKHDEFFSTNLQQALRQRDPQQPHVTQQFHVPLRKPFDKYRTEFGRSFAVRFGSEKRGKVKKTKWELRTEKGNFSTVKTPSPTFN